MSHILEVPLATDGEVLTVDLESDLPEDPAEICVLLENENCATRYWLAFAGAYAQKGDIPAAEEVVDRGLQAPKCSQDVPKLWTYLAWLRISAYRLGSDLDRAVEAVNQAQTLSNGSADSLLLLSALSQASGDIDQSVAPVGQFLKLQPHDISGLFAKARILYHRKNYRAALGVYQELLKRRSSHPDPRLGIALCFWQLGDLRKARLALERILALQSSEKYWPTANAMLGMILISLAVHDSSLKFAEVYTQALNHLVEAFAASKSLLASVGLASYFFSKHDLTKTSKLSELVLNTSASSNRPLPRSLVAEAELWLGRTKHYADDDEAALELYRSAAAVDEAAGLGQALVELRLGSETEALATLEKLTQTHPRSAPIIMWYGIARAQRAIAAKSVDISAVAVLERYIKLSEQNNETPLIEARLVLARLVEKSHPANSLDQIRIAIPAIDSNVLALHVNRSALAFEVGNFEEALAALTVAQSASNAARFAVTIDYNRARILEAMGRRSEARDIHASQPQYVDSRARDLFLQATADIVDTDGSTIVNELTKLVDKNENNSEIRALLGWVLHLNRESREKEQQLWKDTLVKFNKHDSYALVALGNVYLTNAREVRVSRDADADRRDRAYVRAAEFFDKALQIDSRDAYAAQGLAVVYAETHRADQALAILTRVRETLADDAGTCVNAGHCLMELKKYQRATELYELALSKLPSPDSGVLSLLGRAWYARGQASRDPVALQQALDYARKASTLSPDQPALKFNVAYVQFQLADTVRRLPESLRTLTLIKLAQDNLNEAITSLKELAASERPPYPAAELQERAELAESTVAEQLARIAGDQEAHERATSAKLEAARLQLAAEREKVEAEDKKRREDLEAREQALAEERARLVAEAQAWEEERAAEREAELPDRKKARKSSVEPKDDFIDDGEQPPSPESPQSPSKVDITASDGEKDHIEDSSKSKTKGRSNTKAGNQKSKVADQTKHIGDDGSPATRKDRSVVVGDSDDEPSDASGNTGVPDAENDDVDDLF